MLRYTKLFEDREEHYNNKDQLHREDGPAIEMSNGNKYWYFEGKRHRADGPAIEYAPDSSGNGNKHWYLNGVEMTEEEFLAARKLSEFTEHINILKQFTKKEILQYLYDNTE